MKVGFRKPNIKSSVKARTTGRAKRAVKRKANQLYGKKGMGLLHPKEAAYNKVYKKTTVGVGDMVKPLEPGKTKFPNEARKRTTAPADGGGSTLAGGCLLVFVVAVLVALFFAMANG